MMHTANRQFRWKIHLQAGFSLMEGVVAMGVSLVTTAAMVALMANSLGSTSRIVNMTKLSDDMRSTMQILTRDVRRTSYNANALFCYGNDDCATDGSVNLPGDIVINDADNCFTFQTDRNHDGDSVGADDPAGGFRLIQLGDAPAVGAIEMWVGNNQPVCTDSPGWVRVTNPASMDITGFTIDDSLSYTEVIFDDGAGKVISQKVRKLRFRIDGRLMPQELGISRRMEDVISVRNDLLL